jgi:spore coat polysaccharide biosynthesis predicted glycosyltransferase SpsG
MRTSAIAEELIKRGKDVIFVGQISDLPWVEQRITTLGFSHIFCEQRHYVSNSEMDVLVVDSYKIDMNDPFIARNRWRKIVVIFDALTPNYDCNLRIHPGLDSDWIGKNKTPMLSGASFIPFRASLEKNMYHGERRENAVKIAVVAGGSDPYGLVLEIARILASLDEEFEVLLFTKANSDVLLDSRFSFLEIGSQLDALTRSADLIFTTASTSSLEFLARGLCVGVVCAVDNQAQNYNSLGKLGVAAQLGIRKTDNTWEIDEQKISSLVTSRELRRSIVSKAKGLIDFNGASRIVDAITSL